MKRNVILFLIVFGFAGCSSIPFSTMWRLKDFSARDVAFIGPGDIRAQVVHADFIKIGSSNFDIGISNADGGMEEYTFPFEIVDMKEETRGIFFKETIAITTLKLSPAAVEDFVKFQQALEDDEQKQRRIQLSVETSFKSSGPPEEFKFSILLKLDTKEDYFTLIDNATIDMNIDPEMLKKFEEYKAKKEAGVDENGERDGDREE